MYKNMLKRKMPGQMNIDDYLQEIRAQELLGNSDKLCKEQIVYLIEKGYVIKYEVYGIYDVDNVETVILIAKDANAPLFNHVPLSELGITLFERLSNAERSINSHENNCEFISKNDMNIVSYKSFRATHKNGSILEAFYAELDNGYIYMKDYFNCGHLIKATTSEAEKILKDNIESYSYRAKQVDSLPKLADMYRTRCSGNWEYTEVSCPLTNAG